VLILKAFRISHAARINVLGLDLHPNVADPELLNEYLRVYELSKEEGVTVGFFNPSASHVALVDAPVALRFSGYRYLNPYSADAKAAELLAGDLSAVDSTTLNKLILPVASPESQVFTRDVPRPFPTTWGSENRLLRAVLRSKGIIKTRGLSIDDLWKAILLGDIAKKVDLLAATLQMNVCRRDALMNGEEFVHHIGVVVPVKELYPKNLAHVRDELRRYAQATAVHEKNQHSAKPLIGSGVVPASLFGSNSPAPPLVSMSPSSIVPSVQSLPSTNGGGFLNSTPGFRALPTTSTSAKRSAITTAAGSKPKNPRVQGGGSGKGKCVACPYTACGSRKGHVSDCAFNRFATEKDQPEIGHEPRPHGRGQESERQFMLRMFSKHQSAILSRYGIGE
jgi:hypothetical protein